MNGGDSSMREAALVATLSAPPAAGGEEIASLPPSVRWLEVRAERAGELDPDWLRDRFGGELLYSLRNGSRDGLPRRERLLAAAQRWDLVDLGAEDLAAEVLARVPAERRVLSWHGPAAGLDQLRAHWQTFSSVPARLARLVPAAAEPADALAPLRLLREAGRRDLVAYASGPAGWWSRLLAPRLGAPVVFGGVDEGDGEPSIDRLVKDYALPALPPIEELYGIVGPKVTRSLSPRLHNAAYRAAALPALYLPFPAASFGSFWSELGDGALAGLGWPLRGLTVTAPFKESALAAAEEATAVAQRAGAANTLLRSSGGWRADTADTDGVLSALRSRGIGVEGRRAAVVGCGGAGRAAALGLRQAGAEVTLVNRGTERGRFASQLLDLPFAPLAEFDPRPFSLVVHATPVVEEPPFAVSGLGGETIVLELVYGPAATPLSSAAAARGCTVIDGREVLLVEAQRQYRLMTGLEMAAEPARGAIGG